MQPVVINMQILGLFDAKNTETGLGVNEIFRRTGSSNKPYIINSIEHLERCHFIETRKSKHKQQKVKVLTGLGIEMAQLLESINEYDKSYSNLIKKIQRYIMPDNGKEDTRKRILLNSGWTANEAINYDFFLTAARETDICNISTHQCDFGQMYIHTVKV